MKVIGSDPFRNNSDLEHVRPPDGVEEIGFSAFCNCVNLKSITLPPGLKVIRGYAFSRSGPERIRVPGTVSRIGAHAFYRFRFEAIRKAAHRIDHDYLIWELKI